MKIQKFLKVPVILGLTVTMVLTASAAAQKGTVSKTVGSNSDTLVVSNGYGSTSGAHTITSGACVGFELTVVENTAVIESLSTSKITGSIWTVNSKGSVLPGAKATLSYGVVKNGAVSVNSAAQFCLTSKASTKNIQTADKTVTVMDGKNHPYAALEVTY